MEGSNVYCARKNAAYDVSQRLKICRTQAVMKDFKRIYKESVKDTEQRLQFIWICLTLFHHVCGLVKRVNLVGGPTAEFRSQYYT